MNLIEQETHPISDYRMIPLTQGQWAIVDAAVYDYLMQWKWYALWMKNTQSFYAVRADYSSGRNEIILMHRVILGLAKGDKRKGDHANHDTLDNRLYLEGNPQLRIATYSENARNTRMLKANQTGFKGVRYLLRNPKNPFAARVLVDGKMKHLGVFPTAELAHQAYLVAAALHFGEFACAG